MAAGSLARLAGALLILGIAGAPGAAAQEKASVTGHPRVLDGSTLDFSGRRIALWGVKAPGAQEKCKAGALPWLCGAQARSRLEQLVRGRSVECRLETPKKGRCLVPEGDLAGFMVADGLAVADKDGDDYRKLEERARQKRLGVWR